MTVCHASYQKIENLLKDPSMFDTQIFQILAGISETCEIWSKYKQVQTKSSVGLSMAHKFNEIVAMDLKEWTEANSKTWLIPPAYHATRCNASAVIKSKRKEVVVKHLFGIWIKTFGYLQKFLVDNGGEFNSEQFRDFCWNLNIRINSTAAKRPWSTGLVERHNTVIAEGVRKTKENIKCSLDIALV